jgi:predicted metal-dependent hydrolase
MMDYQIKRSSKSLSIRISVNAKAQVIVSAPKLIPEFIIRKFVEGQKDWIESSLAKVKKNQVAVKTDELYIFDKKYQVIINNAASRMGVTVSGETILVNNLSAKTPAKIQQQIEDFLKKTATKYVSTRTAILAKQMGISYKRIAMREQSSRWGSCSSHGNLNFNWRLVHYPPAIIDYVIIHELAHRKEMNHSKKFWEIVRAHDSEYLIHKGQLRKKRYN